MSAPSSSLSDGFSDGESAAREHLADHAAGGGASLIAVRDHSVIGIVTIRWQSNYAGFRERGIPLVHQIAVAGPFRRLGVATLLMNAHTVKVADESSEPSPDELRRVLREQAGLDLAALTPAGGQSRNAFWATDRAGTVSVLKIMPDATPEAVGHLRALDAVLARLRDRGYPAPRFRAIGHVPGLVFWVQQRLPGSPLDNAQGEPDREALAWLLPELLKLNDAQAGLGTGPRRWPSLLTQTLTTGGDGYCLHSTLYARPGTRNLLPVLRRIGDRCGPAIPEGDDFVHYDFTPANLLSDGTAISGVIDINPPVLAGDRAFDLATLLFYQYDYDDIRTLLRARLHDLAGPRAARAYLAHMVLRQVDWSLRHYPAAAATRRHLRLARIIITDIDHSPAY